MSKQTLVQTWLAAIGLAPHILETFEAAGIVNPKDLAELEICHYAALGVQHPGDRKKLFYLVQKIKAALESNENNNEDGGASNDVAVNITVSGVNALVDDVKGSTGDTNNSSNHKEVKKVASGRGNIKESKSRYNASKTPQKQNGISKDKIDDNYSDHFEIEEDGIDEALEDHFRSVLSPPSSADELSSEEGDMDGLSSNGVPSPPKKRGGGGGISDMSDDLDEFLDSNDKNSQSSFRNKREESFLKHMNDRLAKITKSPRKDGIETKVLSAKVKNSTENSKRSSRTSTTSGANVSRLREQTSRGTISRKSHNHHLQEGQKDISIPKSTSSAASTSSSNRKPFANNSRRSNSASTSTSRNDVKESHTADSNSRRVSRRLQEKQLRDRMNSNGSQSTRNSSALFQDDQESIRSSDIRKTNDRKKSSHSDENDLDSILGDSIFPVSPDSGASDSSSTSREGKMNFNIPTLTSNRLSTIPSGRIANPSLRESAKDEDSIFPTEPASTSSKPNSLRKKQIGTQSYESKRSNPTQKSRDDLSQMKITNARNVSSAEYSHENIDSSNIQQKNKISSTNGNGMVFVHGKRKTESWTSRVDSLREANDQIFQEQLKVRRLDNEYEEEMRIRVVVRKRPMSSKEAAHADDADVIHPLQYTKYGRILVYQPKTRVDLTREIEILPFAFDNVFNEASTNCQIYDDTIKHLIPGVFEGRWASVFAYGQTGSGKTFTMMGSTLTGIKARTRNVNHEANYGLYLLAARDLFDFSRKKKYAHFNIGASLFEIYGGKLFDLLNDRGQVKCLENHHGRVCFPGLSEHKITSADDLMKLIEKGASNRSTGSTSANRDSSRSHAVLQLHLRKSNEDVEHGRLTFIDLAGSERGADTDKASRTTRLEGAEINTSLLALKEVIRALATGDAMAHIPFRGSKLTQVLKESFVGKNSRTVMVACVAPNMTNCEHTLNTLRYADRVKERNAETGELAAAIEVASKIEKKMNTNSCPVSAPSVSRSDGADNDWPLKSKETNHVASKDKYTVGKDGDDWLSDLDDDDEQIDDEDHMLRVSMDELNEVLKTPVHKSVSSFSFDEEEIDFDRKNGVRSDFKPKTKKEAVAPLIHSHRAIMSEMLGMVKQEMTLVNCTDEDRALIDEYLDELEEIQDRQLSMISTLRKSLVEYYGKRPSDETDDSFDALLSS